MFPTISPLAPPEISHRPAIHGHVAFGFEGVQRAFADNFIHRGEVGGACCAYYGGRKVVDLWGGVRNRKTGEPWEEDTMVIIYSATKGLAAMTMALAHSRGWLDYERPVAHYWPEFAQHGKGAITVRQLLAHQAGLFALDVPVTRELVADPDLLAEVLARQTPAWPAGERQAYHGITLGFYQGELMRRIDPGGRTLGQFFQDHIATPLHLDAYIRLPHTVPDVQLATIGRPGMMKMITGFPLRFLVDVYTPHSNIRRALEGSDLPHDSHSIYARDFEVPSGGGVASARGLARAYSAFARGQELGLTRDTLALLAAPAVPSAHGFYDECMKNDAKFSLGFMKPSTSVPFGGPSSFGSPGAGGAMGFADPEAGIGYGYVTSQMGTTLTGDPREVAIRDALYAAVQQRS